MKTNPEPGMELPEAHKVRFPRLSFFWIRLKFAFNNHYTVDLDSPTWEQELDNIIEIEEEKSKP